jgi:hypothetical protein
MRPDAEDVSRPALRGKIGFSRFGCNRAEE